MMTGSAETIDGMTPEERAYPPQTWAYYLGLSVYWFALSFIWSGMITIVMQTLVKEMAGEKKDLYLGWALALGALVSTVVCLVVGALSDRSRWALGKRRPYLIVGTVFSVPSLLWLAHIGSLPTHIGLIPLLMLDFCLIQFWLGVATSPYQAIVPDMVPKERQGAASAYMGMGSLLGQLAGLILCTYLIRIRGGLWIIMASFSALLVAAMLFTVCHVRERPAIEPDGAAPGPRSGLMETLLQSFHVRPREHPDFFWLIASRFVINMGFYSATEFLLYYVSDTLRAPQPEQTVGVIFIVVTVSGLLGNFPAGILSDRVSKKLVVYVSTAITGVAALVFLLTSSITVAFVAAFIFGMGFGAFAAVDWALATNLLPEHDEAKFMGVWHVSFTVPQVIAPVVGGLLAYIFNQQFGQGFGYRVVLFLVLVYLAIGAAMIQPIRERVIGKKEEDVPLALAAHPEGVLQPQEPDEPVAGAEI
jgi:MFS family permease